jgi:hypothetical protein
MSRWLVATMATILFFALVIAVTGFEFLFSGNDPISQPDATPYLGPAMVTSVAVVVWFATAFGARRGTNIVVTALVAAATSYLVMLGVGSLAYAFLHGDVAELIVFPAGYALGPFVVGTVVVALAVVVGGVAVARQSSAQRQSQPPHNPGAAQGH